MEDLITLAVPCKILSTLTEDNKNPMLVYFWKQNEELVLQMKDRVDLLQQTVEQDEINRMLMEVYASCRGKQKADISLGIGPSSE